MKAKRFSLTGVVILALIGCVVGKSYGHPTAVISGCATGKEVCVDSFITFKGDLSEDTDEGGESIVDYEWSWPTEAYGESGQGTDTFSCKFTPAGTYTVKLRVQDNERVWSTWKSCTVYVVEVVSVASSTTTVHLGCNDDIMFTVTTNPPSHYDPITWSAPGGDPPFQSGGETFITHWDDPGAKTVTATCGSSSENKQVYVVGVSTVEWETFSDNTPLDNNKIFPGKKDHGDISWDTRRTVWVKVTLVPMPQAAFGPIYCSCWDPDDPSADPTLDTNGDAGGDNFNDGTGLNKAGEIIFAPPNANGAGHWFAQFQVSRQPGNNFTIAVSTCEDRLDELTQLKLDSGDIPRSVELSPVLTTWRKLWIERDSMNVVATTGAEKDLTSSTITALDASSYDPGSGITTLDVDDLDGDNYWDGDDRLNGGKLVVGGNEYTIDDMYDTWGDETLDVQGNPYGDGVRVNDECTLYDDDYSGSSNFNIVLPLRQPLATLDRLMFEEAYIEPEYLSSAYEDTVSFNLNFSDIDSLTPDVTGSTSFWTVMVMNAFQPQAGNDEDPDSESATGGLSIVSWSDNPDKCAIYHETGREMGLTMSHHMAHEIGHTQNIGNPFFNHCSNAGCVMQAGATGWEFCGECKKVLRERTSW